MVVINRERRAHGYFMWTLGVMAGGAVGMWGARFPGRTLLALLFLVIMGLVNMAYSLHKSFHGE